MKPRETILNEDNSSVIINPSESYGIFHMRVSHEDYYGQSAVIGKVSLVDAVKISQGDDETLKNYIQQTGVGKFTVPGGADIKEHRDGTGHLFGGHSNLLEELAPYPPLSATPEAAADTTIFEIAQHNLQITDDLSEYAGQFVAIRDGKVVAHSHDAYALANDPELQPTDSIKVVEKPGTRL